MQRNSSRIVAIILAALFLVTNTRDAIGLGCPHHELVPSTPDYLADVRHPEAPAQLAAFGAHDHLAEAGPTPDHREHHCTCIGNCNGTAGTPPPSSMDERLLVLAITSVPLPPDGEHHLPGPIPYLLPLANAPPLSL